MDDIVKFVLFESLIPRPIRCVIFISSVTDIGQRANGAAVTRDNNVAEVGLVFRVEAKNFLALIIIAHLTNDPMAL
jgi:hypothetical protein